MKIGSFTKNKNIIRIIINLFNFRKKKLFKKILYICKNIKINIEGTLKNNVYPKKKLLAIIRSI
jgi:hypothetical protein